MILVNTHDEFFFFAKIGNSEKLVTIFLQNDLSQMFNRSLSTLLCL